MAFSISVILNLLRHNSLMAKQLPKTNTEAKLVIFHPKVESESSKEDKNAELMTQSLEAGNSIGSSSSSLRPIIIHRDNLHASLSPIRRSALKASSSQTEGHPNAVRNIQNYTLLQASITDIIKPRGGGGGGGDGMARVRRSLSTLDLIYRDPEDISKLFGLEK